MRIVHRTPTGDRIVEIDIDDPARSVADLLAALGAPMRAADSDVVIDDVAVTADRPLSAVTLCEGSVVELTTDLATTKVSARTLAIVGGVRAGAAMVATSGITIGQGPGVDFPIADPTLSAHHCTVETSGLRDNSSRNGTTVEGHPLQGLASLGFDTIVRAGATRLMLRRPLDDRPLAVAAGLGAAGGTIPFNRPPRVDPIAANPDLVVPDAAPEPPDSEPLSVAGIVLPIIAGAVVAVLFSPFMAVFAALGPVLTIGTWWERRRRSRKTHRRVMAAFAQDLTRLAADLPALRTAEISRRRRLHPDPAEIIRRASLPSVRCWERRPGHADAFVVGIGAHDARVAAPTRAAAGGECAPEAMDLVAALALMPDVPLTVDLAPGHIVGIVGPPVASRAMARSVVMQMATHHGPADLAVAVAADTPPRWDWCRWLPHTSDHSAGRRGANVLATGDAGAADAVVAGLGGRALLGVVDGVDPFQGRLTAGRRLLRSDHAAAIVLVADAHRLPAGCSTVVTVDSFGRLRMVDPRRAGPGSAGLAWGMGRETAEGASRRMARLDDPELPTAGAGVPSSVALLGLLGISGDDPGEIEQRWLTTDHTADLATPIGADGEGPVVLDFVRDGPHVLVGGTTGAGKSELLRSMVAGVAASADPDHVAMVLVDYKGGAAFDCCAELPHVAGLVTDLDEELAERALRCLEAELRYRERRLRELGADDLASYRTRATGRDDLAPLPRLLVVVDEFASLATDLPEFLDALVGIAQRGRSLGVHMVLATQRPAGVVTDDIRANTGCRIALRVTDRNDSVDVIDAPDAAAIARSRPGRGVARFGPGELAPFQSALSTGRSVGGSGISVRVEGTPASSATTGPTDLQRVVATIAAAYQRRGGIRPRSPWPPRLPDRLVRGDPLLADVEPSRWLLVDEPDRQRQSFASWRIDDGHLVVVGGPGCGATTTLAAAALAVTAPCGPGRAAVHLHVIDLDAGKLAPLGALAATGTMVAPTDSVRRGRLIRWLDAEVSRRRRAGQGDDPALLLLVDDFAGLARAHDPIRETAIHEQFARVWADGPAVGVVVALSVRRAGDLAPNLISTVGAVLLHRSGDPSEGLRFSLKVDTSEFPPGRAVRSGDGEIAQVIMAAASIDDAVRERSDDPPPTTEPHEVGELAAVLAWADLAPTLRREGGEVSIEVGLRDSDLAPATLRLHRGEHALILGPARSGRTNTLAAIGRVAGADAIVVAADATSRSGCDLARRVGCDPVAAGALDDALRDRSAAIVLVDDCLDIDDPTGSLAALVAAPPPDVHVIAAARPDRYRAAYGHWSADIRGSRAGILLRPDPIDGDLLGRQLPARLSLAPVPGRGVLIAEGGAETVQVVEADDYPSAE